MPTKKEHQSLIIFRFIDAYVELHGELNVYIIAKQFRLHRTTAKSILTQYQKKKPDNLHYDVINDKYFKGNSFEKVCLINESSLLYLNAIDLIYSERVK